MRTFSELLKTYIDANGYTTYQLANLSGVNRTTIQRAITSGRIPHEEALEKIIHSLKLTYSEQQQLYDAYEIATDGAYSFTCRRYIKKLLETLSMPFASELPTFDVSQKLKLSLKLKPGSLIQTTYDIKQVLKLLLNDEVYNQSEPSLSLSLPMETDFLNLFFSEIYNTDFNKIQIRQLLYLLKNPACENRKTYNLEVLSNVLPLALRKPSGYHVYYTYTDSIPTAETLAGFPYYILFTKYVLLLSPDLGTAWLEGTPKMAAYFHQLFTRACKYANQLVYPFESVSDYLQKNLELDSQARFNYSVEYQPCFLSLFNKELLEHCIRPELPGKKDLIHLMLERISQYNSMEKNFVIFNSDSLAQFIQDGVIINIPAGFAHPCTLEERLYLLEQLELACQSAHHMIRAMDTSFFDFGKQVYISIQKNKEVCLYTYDLDQGQFRLIVIAESTAHDAFCDFIHYMAESNSKYLCSREETLKRIKGYKSALLQMIIMSR